jgi:hypothetical protein
MALLLGRRLRRRLALCLFALLISYYLLTVDVCLRCLVTHGYERPKCHHVYARYAIIGGPVVCMERHWSRAMHKPTLSADGGHAATGPAGLSIMGSFAFDRAVEMGLRSPKDEMNELGFNRTERVQQHLRQQAKARGGWPLLPATTVEPPTAAITAGLRRIEPVFTFDSSGSGSGSTGGTSKEPAAGGSGTDESPSPLVSSPDGVEWPQQCGQLRYSLFIPHHHASGLGATIAAVGSAMAFGPGRIHVVDTSGNQSAAKSPALAALGVQVLQPARGTPLPYALLHEYIRREALATSLDVYFYMHSDVTLERGVVSEALRALCVSW